MNDDRIDFTSLDPGRDPERLERSLGEISRRAAPGLAARRARRADVWAQLAAWQRPVLAMAALVAIALIAALALVRPARTSHVAAGSTEAGASKPGTLMEAAGAPSGIAGWVETGAQPSPANLLGLWGA